MRTKRALTLGAIAALVAWAALPLAILIVHTLRHGGVVSGSDGALPGADQLFYMDSIRQSAEHLLITDHFDLTLGQPVFLQPVFLLAGLMWRVGASIQASFWLLQIAAAVVLALGTLAFVGRYLRRGSERAVALLLGLFHLTPLLPLLAWTGAISPLTRFELNFPAGESMPAWQLWGYPHAPIAVGVMAAVLAGATKPTAPRNNCRIVLMVLGAALVAWLHPWQGATLIVVLAVLIAQTRARMLVPVLLGAALPLIYEEILSRSDAAWRLDSIRNAVGHDPLWMVLVALVPLAVPAVLGLRGRRGDSATTVLITWPVAGLGVYFLTDQFPYHALQGVTIPLAVLAIRGWPAWGSRLRPLGSRAVALALTTVAIASGVAYEISTFRDSINSGVAPYWLTADERAALSYLDHAPEPGGVLARYYIGMAVPAFTGRRTWVGEWTWTPDFNLRINQALQLLEGGMRPASAQRFVRATGARFILGDCGTRPISSLLGPLLRRARHFGCATVYELG